MPETFIIYVLIPLLFLSAGLVVGTVLARNHDKALEERLRACGPFSVTNSKHLPPEADPEAPPFLVVAEVTLGIDHFRGFLGKLVNLVGGEVRSFTKIADRARREVTQQLREQAAGRGYDGVANLRLEFAHVTGSTVSANKAVMVTILGYGTAYRRRPAEPGNNRQ